MQPVAVLPSLAPHGSKARLQNGHDSQGFMAKPCTPHPIRQALQLFKLQTGNERGRGGRPSSLSLGGVRVAVLFSGKENSHLLRTPARRGRLFHVLLKRDHTQMLEQDLEPDQNENDAAGEFGAALVARAEHIADVHTRNRDHKRRAADDRDGRHNIHL